MIVCKNQCKIFKNICTDFFYYYSFLNREKLFFLKKCKKLEFLTKFPLLKWFYFILKISNYILLFFLREKRNILFASLHQHTDDNYCFFLFNFELVYTFHAQVSSCNPIFQKVFQILFLNLEYDIHVFINSSEHYFIFTLLVNFLKFIRTYYANFFSDNK